MPDCNCSREKSWLQLFYNRKTVSLIVMNRYYILALVLLVGCKNNSHQEPVSVDDGIDYYEYEEQPTTTLAEQEGGLG